ncbi:hypothetical protein D3C74_161220 [compost metagenome]
MDAPRARRVLCILLPMTAPAIEPSESKVLLARRTGLVLAEHEPSNQVAGAGQLVDLIRNNPQEYIPAIHSPVDHEGARNHGKADEGVHEYDGG